MKAFKLTGIKKMELLEVPVPEIVHPNDVLIKMKAVGVCGSDIHYYNTGRIGSQVVEFPFTVGHEGAGIVEKIGPAVTDVKPGDRIAVEPAISCGECEQCLEGRPHTCENNRFLGCPGQIEGNLVEYIVLPDTQCLKLGEKTSFDDATLSEPLSIGYYANKMADYSIEHCIAIVGFGPIGMSVALTAKSRGVTRIFSSEKIKERMELANRLGFKCSDANLEDINNAFIEKAGRQVNVVFECSGTQDGLDTAVEIVRPGGKIMMIGIPEFDRWSICADKGRRKEITFVNVRRQNHCTEDVLQLLESKKLNADAMITHRFDFRNTDKAFELVSSYKDGVLKAMIDF